VGRWKMPSRAIIFGGECQQWANKLKHLPIEERAAEFGELCFSQIQYTVKNSSQPVNSGEIWTRKIGTCADFSHLFIALCRMSGLPARYVAGYCLGEGQMHAWSEFWHQEKWHGFDATNNRWVDDRYISVAKGRDFYDCAPHEGSFFGKANANLTLFCRTDSLQA
jgi:transglutaminase-like putative cysteine protease